jgi:FKBP-type peptidyl-prolyl cis-trans isomerase
MRPAKQGDTVRVHYRGKLQDGSVFDETFDREPLRLPSVEVNSSRVLRKPWWE